ncbi:MAG: hypothetical protein ACLQMH_07910 [Solirubrobacteraceae bacterium]
MPSIPGNPFYGPKAHVAAYAHLAEHHGVSRGDASDRLHAIKSRHAVGAAERIVIGRTGCVYRESDGDWLGSLTARTT